MPGERAVLSRLYAGPFPALEEKLLSRLAGDFGRDPFREQLLLVPSNELREHLLRRLASRWDGSAAGSSILTLYDFALRLLRHRGLFPGELSPAQMAAALSAAVRETYAGGDGDFAGIAATPGFLPALARTLGDFEEGWVGDEALRAAERAARTGGRAGRAARWSEWRRLAASVERKVHALGGMTRRRIFQEAVSGFEQPGYPFRTTLYGFYDFTRLQWTLVDALLASGLLDDVYFPGLFGDDGTLSPSFAYAALTWDRLLRAFDGNVTRLDDPAPPGIRSVRERLFSPADPAGAGPVPFSVLSSPHEAGEIRLAARVARGWLDGRPGTEVLLVARRMAEDAVPEWERTAAEYGVRAAGRLQVPLGSVPPVRVLLQMIESAQEGFPRRKVIDVLSSPYLRPARAAEGPPPRPDLWDVWTRERMVVSGEDWDLRLSGFRRPDGEEETGGNEEERNAQLALLREEVRALRESLRPVEEASGYAAFAAAVRSLLVREFQLVDDGSAEADRDLRAASALFSLLDDIERIPGGAVPWPPAEGAPAWFRTLLSGQRLFVGERGGMRVPGAVVAGDLFSLRGVTADRILFLSVNEDAVPAQVEEDPLLPDEDREELNRILRRKELPDALSLRRRNAAEEKLLFSLPAASAREEVACGVLRADAEGAARRPSRYLLLLLSRFVGPGVFAEDWEATPGVRLLSLPRSPLASLAGPGPLSGREAALARWSEGVDPVGDGAEVPWHRILPAVAALRARREGALFPDPWTGIPTPAVASASALDELAACPYRFFLRRMAGLAPVEEPEENLLLGPPETGRILHDILRRLGEAAAAGAGWPEPSEAARKAVARFARENPTGLPGLYRIRCRGIEADVAAFVEWERARASSGREYRVAAVERPFEIPGEAGLAAFRGRVDRIDRGPQGEVEIVDYKYRDGRSEKAPLERIRRGLSHQVPVYMEFAGTLSPGVRASLLFLKRGVHAVTVEGSLWNGIRAEWAEALSGWLSLVRSGRFPPLPHHRFSFAGKAPPRYCDPCPFKDHCRVSPAFEGTRRETDALVRRVATDPALGRVPEFRPSRGE